MKPTKLINLMLICAIGTLMLFPVTQPTNACAPAPRKGSRVEIANESAIIIWNEKTKTQHFIRRASFNSSSDDFGFLVPTPSEPALEEVKDSAFDTLADFTKPRIIEKKAPSGGGGCNIGCGAKEDAAKSPSKGLEKDSVRVLQQKRVGEYDASVLEADDADALAKWLEENEYPFSPELTAWVKPYIEQKWKITAFKIAPADEKSADDEEQLSIAVSAVRMTFQTDHPVFPYREPQRVKNEDENEWTPKRLLRVYLLSDTKMKGKLDHKSELFPGKVVWAKPLTSAQKKSALEQVNVTEEGLPETLWLTEIEDHSSPRPGVADVYFSAHQDSEEIERRPEVRYVQAERTGDTLWACIAGAALIGMVIVLPRRVRR